MAAVQAELKRQNQDFRKAMFMMTENSDGSDASAQATVGTTGYWASTGYLDWTRDNFHRHIFVSNYRFADGHVSALPMEEGQA